MNKAIALEAGLAEAGKDDEGNHLYIGTDKKWKRYSQLEEIAEREEHTNSRIDFLLHDSECFAEFYERAHQELGIPRETALEDWNEVWQAYC